MIKFNFKEFQTRHLGKIFRPSARVVFYSKNVKIETELLVDPGADITLIPKTFGQYLGLKRKGVEKLKRLFGVGKGGVPVLFRDINIIIGKYVIKAKIAWIQDNSNILLLGRYNVFDEFNIEFRQKDRITVFKKGNEDIVKNSELIKNGFF